MTDTIATPRRTKRRYAHELYPLAEAGEVRPLAVEVPALYAQALGNEVWETGWFDGIRDDQYRQEAADRTVFLVQTRQIAFLADALAQGLTGDAAWEWAAEYAEEESGELVWERAERYGVRPQAIKPYPCGPEQTSHRHFADQEDRSGIVTRAEGPEDTCIVCTEPVPLEGATQ
ncbi:hypothetical protein [Curtobacterium sp. MCBA15_004]|uniref:hypothetical protein n=1 Tax=Curtobacterium sp. MCBA15_004 TaxID=1898733 RepID=UPI0008DCACEC|nr:hypothetical protein [Curtobacterium sp. MCBA15_004]WIA96428.1 hypothetical protein QOL16_15220 [Curtobacterium sp. MCBA15_004]